MVHGAVLKECRISVEVVPSGVLVLEELLIPMKVGTDSDLIPVTRFDAMAVTFGAKRRWRFMVLEVTGIGQLEFGFNFIFSSLLP